MPSFSLFHGLSSTLGENHKPNNRGFYAAMNDEVTAPDVLMLLSSGCGYCPGVLASLGEMLKEGVIGRLDAVNIATHPEIAQRYGVRSVPWVLIGEYEFSGARSKAELTRWAQRAGTVRGMAEYFTELLKGGNLESVVRVALRDAAHVDALLLLLQDTTTELHVSLGIGAVFEQLGDGPALRERLDALGALTRHSDARVRADVCHYLSLTKDPRALPYVEPLLSDADPQVREIAQESRDALSLG